MSYVPANYTIRAVSVNGRPQIIIIHQSSSKAFVLRNEPISIDAAFNREKTYLSLHSIGKLQMNVFRPLGAYKYV